MANKERNKRAARKARSQERAQREEQAQQTGSASQKPAVVKASAKMPAKPKKRSRVGQYFADVKQEMKRVTWPTPSELKSYSIAVIALLIVFGVALWAIDTLITSGIAGITSVAPNAQAAAGFMLTRMW